MTSTQHFIYPILAALVLPLLYHVLPLLYDARLKLCTLALCIRPIIACAKDPICRSTMDCMEDCDNPHSDRRQRSKSRFQYLQFPEDPNLCRYECFDLIASEKAEAFIECAGASGCLTPTEYSDKCAPLDNTKVLPFDTIPTNVWKGRWRKLYTNSWDVWPCQETEFYPPQSTSREPKEWMTKWPHDAGVWRMDLNWTVANRDYGIVHTFSMSNEMYPGEQWEFDVPKAPATLKTRAVMWGTEAHENWYLLHYDPETMTALLHACAYTPAINGFDAITVVLRKEGQGPFTDDMADKVQHTALQVLGAKYGTLLRIPDCNMQTRVE